MFRFFVPGAHMMPLYKLGRWDGHVSLFKDNTLPVNLVLEDSFIDLLINRGYDIDIEDQRVHNDVIIEEVDENFLQDGKPGFILRPYQTEMINLCREHKSGIFIAGTGAGKCLGLGTLILMADGSIKRVEDVKVGDRLAGPYGNNTVLSLARGREEMYRITPTKGDSYTCNASHLLSLKKSGDRPIHLSDGTIVTGNNEIVCRADVLYHSHNKAKHCMKGWRSPVAAFDNQTVELPVPPYILGIWLGDGTKDLSNRCAITKPEGRVVDAWTEWAVNKECDIIKEDSNGTRCPTWKIRAKPGGQNHCLFLLRDLNIDIKVLNIPHEYKTASWEHRAELLAGILDTDGCVSRGGWDYISKNRALAEDTAFLARSLGLAAYVTECQKGIKALDFVGTYWRVSISGDSSIVPCKAKIPAERTINKDVLKHGIKIEPIGEDDYYGFELSGDRLFMLGDFTVTHNTATCAGTVKSFLPFGKVVTVVPSIDLVVQTAKNYQEFGIDTGVFYGDEKIVKDSLVSTWQSLINVPELMDGVIAILCDEVHKYKAQEMDTFLKTVCSHVPHRYGYTGTLPKSSLGRTQLKGSIGPVLFTKDTYELQQEGVLAKTDVEMIQLMEPKDQTVFHDPKHSRWEDEMAHLLSKPARLDWIVEYIKDLQKTGNTLVFVNNYAAVDALMKRMPNAHQADGRVKPSVRQKLYKEFNDMDDAVMVCTIQTASTGIDILRIFNVVFIEPGKSFIEIIQSIGRGLRKGGDKEFLNIKDIYADTKYSKKHAAERKSYFKEKSHKITVTKTRYIED